MIKNAPLYGKILSFFILVLILVSCGPDNENGWTTYRHDGFRSGVTTTPLPDNLQPQWTFKTSHEPVTAWHKPGEELPRMHSDNTYHIAAANGLTYFGSSVDDKVYALDTFTGKIKWTFFTNGPVRFAPSLWKGRVYVGSDDGYVYCLKASSGKLVWKYRPGPSDKKVLGNGRMISLWPVRTSVLVKHDVVYFGAGVFPYEGIYICALDAKNGNILWKNDTIGDKAYELQYGGISPHGYLLASKDVLYVPSGRAMPAAFNLHNGQFLYTLSPGSKVGGTWGLISDDLLIAGVDRSGTPAKVAYDVETGRRQGDAFVSLDGIDMVTTKNISYVVTQEGIHAVDRIKFPTIKDRIDSLQKKMSGINKSLRKMAQVNLESNKKANKEFKSAITEMEGLKSEIEQIKNSATKWQIDKKDLNTIIMADDKLVAGGKDAVFILDAQTGKDLQKLEMQGTAMGLAVSGGCLLTTNEKGQIFCFGKKNVPDTEMIEPNLTATGFEKHKLSSFYQKAAEQILQETGVKKGYCLVLGAREGRLAYELARKSDLKVIGIEKDAGKIKKARKNLDKAGLYGSRVVVENWDISNLPDYFANLVVSDDFLLSGKINTDSKEIYRVLKPLGGVACFGQAEDMDHPIRAMDQQALVEQMQQIDGTLLQNNSNWITVTRGALQGAGGWTHQYADPANTVCSDDQLTNYPFSVLWFGEPGPEKMVERHARAASPVARDGRMFIQGENVIMAYDSYNGIKLWERDIPGANRVRVDVDGGNLALSDYGLLVATGNQCLLLDVQTGQTLKTFELPALTHSKSRRWGYIACSGSTLYGSAAKSFANEYNFLWKNISGKIAKKGSEQSGVSSYMASQFQSEERARNEMQQSGAKWHFITNFPAWDGGIVGVESATEQIMHSDVLFAMDIKIGKTKWIYLGKKIGHITISIGDGKIHFADNQVTPEQKQKAIQVRKKYAQKGIWENYAEPVKNNQTDVRLVTVLDCETGAKIWQQPVDLSGCGGDAVASAYKDNTLLFFGSFGLHDKWRFPAGELKWHRVTALSSDTGHLLWSRPLNYMVRPVIIDDTIIVEPRACDLKTGKIKTRVHPITGQTVPWEYYRPGHTCAVTSASSTCLFYRSYNAAFYDLKNDHGITYYGAIRPGCWINMVPANGLLLFPEASAGCTCSFPLRTTMVLKPQPYDNKSDWSIFVSQGPVTPVKRLAINLGAPGDKKDNGGNIWFGYPRPGIGYGIKFDLNEKIRDNMGYFYYDARGVDIKGTDKPWLCTSGCAGLSECTIPLIDELWNAEPGRYTVRLGFFAPLGNRTFDIKLQDETVLQDFNLTKEAGRDKHVIVKEFNNVQVTGDLVLELVPKKETVNADQAPVINFIEILREDVAAVDESAVSKELLKNSEANEMLRMAQKALADNDVNKALDLFHAVFKSFSSKAAQIKALHGMEQIGSPKSLNVIEKYLRYTEPIYWDYKIPTSDFIDKVNAVYVAIALNQADTNPQKAKAMLDQVSQIATDVKLKEKISAELFKLGDQSTTAISDNIVPGISYDFYEGHFTTVDGLDLSQPKSSGVMNTIKLDEPKGVDSFGYHFKGYLSVPKDGFYTFFIESNDGSKLYIHDRELVNNDGAHGVKEESGKTFLQKGLQPFAVKYFQMGSGKALKVSWQSDNLAKKEISQKYFFHEVAK